MKWLKYPWREENITNVAFSCEPDQTRVGGEGAVWCYCSAFCTLNLYKAWVSWLHLRVCTHTPPPCFPRSSPTPAITTVQSLDSANFVIIIIIFFFYCKKKFATAPITRLHSRGLHVVFLSVAWRIYCFYFLMKKKKKLKIKLL